MALRDSHSRVRRETRMSGAKLETASAPVGGQSTSNNTIGTAGCKEVMVGSSRVGAEADTVRGDMVVCSCSCCQSGRLSSTSCYRSAATAFTTFVHGHLLRMLQSHMCARSFRFIERPLPLQTPTATTTSVMTATTQPLPGITTTLIIHHYSQSVLSSRV